MKKFKSILPAGGLLLMGVTNTMDRFIDIPSALHYTLMLTAVSLVIWGTVLIARSPEMKNSKLRRWKLRLIGREPK
ncbi:MAG: hypothetical protein FWD99_03065 [Oscillospiraceae bacterium]|nr:hypothetical protein [Oscillospiraceae bacterium]